MEQLLVAPPHWQAALLLLLIGLAPCVHGAKQILAWALQRCYWSTGLWTSQEEAVHDDWPLQPQTGHFQHP